MSHDIEFLPPRRPNNGSGEILDLDMTPTSTGAAPATSEELHSLLREAVDRKASDVHLVPGYPASVRVNGKLEPLNNAVLKGGQVQRLLEASLPQQPGTPLDMRNDVDCSIAVPHNNTMARFRANVYRSQGNWCACLRHIPGRIPALDELGFPPEIAEQLQALTNGLVIFTGTTGSGKSTSMASVIQMLANRGRHHVLTIEEPIEYLYNSRAGSLFTQREVGRDVDSFSDGLKYGLRQDPDVILVGETRDRDTAQMVLSAAETGHLVLTTLHTRDAKGAVSRFTDLFPAEIQEEARKQLAMSLRYVISQHLLPPADAKSTRVLAVEVLRNTQQAETAIRSGRIESLETVLQTGRRDGMCLLDDDLQRLVTAGRITPATARRFARRPEAILATRSGKS